MDYCTFTVYIALSFFVVNPTLTRPEPEPEPEPERLNESNGRWKSFNNHNDDDNVSNDDDNEAISVSFDMTKR